MGPPYEKNGRMQSCRLGRNASWLRPGRGPGHPLLQLSACRGGHLVDGKGNCVRLMGVMQSIHPFFNHGYWGGGSDDAAFLENKTTVGLYATTENL